MMKTAARELFVLDAIGARRAVRAFLPNSVSRADILEILRVAGRAPSGTNTQPWRAYVVEGRKKEEISEAVLAASEAEAQQPDAAARYEEAYPYYPARWMSPYIERRRENGFGLYGVLGIQKGDRPRMHEQHQQNFRFFGAPVGIFFTIDRRLERGSLVDYGMFLQNVMLAAQAFDIASCPQAAWNRFGSIILPQINAASEELLVCGMALGYEDREALVNQYRAPRLEPEQYVTWLSEA